MRTFFAALLGLPLLLLAESAPAGAKKLAEGNAVIRGRAGPSDIVITTSARLAAAIHSLKWHGKEFIHSHHGRGQLQSAAHFDCGQEFIPEAFNPTEAGARANGTGEKSTSKLQSLKAEGNELTAKTQMAFWLAPWEKTEGRFARNDTILSNHLLSKHVRIGYKKLPHAIEYEVTFTVPKGEFHRYAQFEAIAGFLPAEFSQFWSYDIKQGTLAKLEEGPGEQPLPLVFATADGKYALGVYSPQQPSKGYEKSGYGRFRFDKEKVTKWNLVFRQRDEKGLAAGDYRFRCFVVVGSLEDVRNTLGALVQEFQ
jgi:hypothetical protein